MLPDQEDASAPGAGDPAESQDHGEETDSAAPPPAEHLAVEVVPAAQVADKGEAQDQAEPPDDEVVKLRDQLARALADYDNLSRRAAREREEAMKFANQGLIEKLLPTLDDIMRACAVAEGEQRTAFEMVRDRLLSTLQDRGLELVDHDIPFDPNLHEALVVETSSAEEDGTILDVIEQGYLLHDRLLRPSRVRVVQKE